MKKNYYDILHKQQTACIQGLKVNFDVDGNLWWRKKQKHVDDINYDIRRKSTANVVLINKHNEN